MRSALRRGAEKEKRSESDPRFDREPALAGAWRVVWKRAAHDRVVVAAAFLTTLLATTLLASGPVYADAVALSGLQRALADAPVRDVSVAVSDHLGAADNQAADERVTGAVEWVFGRDGVTVHRSGVSSSFALPDLPDVPADGLTVFGYYDDLPGHAELLSGAWPAVAPAGASRPRSPPAPRRRSAWRPATPSR